MKHVYIWPLTYILLFNLSLPLKAQPSHTLMLLKSCIGSMVTQIKIHNHHEINTPNTLHIGELVCYKGRYALIATESTTDGNVMVITNLNPQIRIELHEQDIVKFDPPLILKHSALMEQLSSS